MRTLALSPAVALLLLAPAHLHVQEPAKAPQTYALIVNSGNPAKDTPEVRKLVKTLYLKELTRWSDGTEARPYGREAASTEHTAFAAGVLGMTDAELARHWLRLKNMNGTTPPKEIDNERMLIKHVARHDGAFGVVKTQAANAPGVRVLFEFTKPTN
jgi:hypothetical protein